MIGLLVVLPLRTKNPLNMQWGNSRVAAIMRTARRRDERKITRALVAAALNRRGLGGLELVPCVVTLTRVSAGKMDDDGIAASCKGIRDGIADALGIDDGDRKRLRFAYDQRKGPRGFHAVEALLERRTDISCDAYSPSRMSNALCNRS
jgi:hypothetical protein